MTEPIAPSRSRSRILSVYVGLWVCLAVVAAAYLAAAAHRPDLLARLQLPGVPTVDKEAGRQGQFAAAADLSRLETRFGELQSEVAGLTSRVSGVESREAALGERISQIIAAKGPEGKAPELQRAATPSKGSLQSAATTSTAALPVVIPALPPAPERSSETPDEVPVVTVPTRVINAASQQAATAPAEGTSAIETGSLAASTLPARPAAAPKAPSAPAQATVAAPAIGFGSAEVRPAPKPVEKPAQPPVAVFLGDNASLEALRFTWSILSEQNDSLRKLTPRVSATDAQGARSYRLLAGPITDRNEANRICSQLRAKGAQCRLGSYGGEAL